MYWYRKIIKYLIHVFAMMNHIFNLENETATIKDEDYDVVCKSTLKLFSKAIFVSRVHVLVNTIHVEGRSVFIMLLEHSHTSVKHFLESEVRHRS